MRNVTDTPDKWVMIKIEHESLQEPLYKIFATWAGGYLDGDGWKLNSGVSKVEEDEKYFYFIGYSGSAYKCHKKSYGVATSFGESMLFDKILGRDGIELLEEDTDFINIKK